MGAFLESLGLSKLVRRTGEREVARRVSERRGGIVFRCHFIAPAIQTSFPRFFFFVAQTTLERGLPSLSPFEPLAKRAFSRPFVFDFRKAAIAGSSAAAVCSPLGRSLPSRLCCR